MLRINRPDGADAIEAHAQLLNYVTVPDEQLPVECLPDTLCSVGGCLSCLALGVDVSRRFSRRLVFQDIPLSVIRPVSLASRHRSAPPPWIPTGSRR